MKAAAAIILLALGLLLTSCANSYRMYSGRRLANDEVAILEQPGAGPAMVLSVDGKPYDGALTWAGVGRHRWELLPGAHRVEVDMRAFAGESHSGGPQTIAFTAKAGQVYQVSYRQTSPTRSGFLSESFNWAPAIWPQHPVTDADRVKANKG